MAQLTIETSCPTFNLSPLIPRRPSGQTSTSTPTSTRTHAQPQSRSPSPLLAPASAATCPPRTPSPLSQDRKPLWEGQDPVRLAAREASIRARMESRKSQMAVGLGVPSISEAGGRRSVSSPTFWQAGVPPRKEPPLSSPTSLPKTPEMGSVTVDLGDSTEDISPRTTFASTPESRPRPQMQPRSQSQSYLQPRAYSPFDVGLDRVRTAFGTSYNSPFPSPGGPGSGLGSGPEGVFWGRNGVRSRSITPTYQPHQSEPGNGSALEEEADLSDLKPWASYFDDPYRSPSASPVKHLLVPPASLGGSPRLPWTDTFNSGNGYNGGKRRGSSPNTSSVRASTLMDLDEISKSLTKKSRRLSSASLLTGGSAGERRYGYGHEQGRPVDATAKTDFGPPLDRVDGDQGGHRNRDRTASDFSATDDLSPISPTTPYSAASSRNNRDSISSLLSLSTSGRATPIGLPPQAPLPLLPGKKARRKIRVRPSDKNTGGWEVDRSRSPVGLQTVGLGAGIGLGFSIPDATQASVEREVQVERPSTERSRMSSVSSTSSATPTWGTTTESPEMARYRSSTFGTSEILDPTAPTASVELSLPQNGAFMDLVGSLDEGVSVPAATLQAGLSGKARRKSSRFVLDFPLPPARGLRISLETHQEEDLNDLATNPGNEVGDIPNLPTHAMERKDSLASDTTWDEDLSKATSCASFRSSCSSQTTAPSSCAQLTPRSSLERFSELPHLRSESCDFDLRQALSTDLDDTESLTAGDLAAMIEEVETKIPSISQTPRLAATVTTMTIPPDDPKASATKLPRRPLLPPGPDVSFWGEPEVILSDNDFHSILRFDHTSVITETPLQANSIKNLKPATCARPLPPQIRSLEPVGPTPSDASVARSPVRARVTGLRQPTPSRLPTMQTPSRRTPNLRQNSSPMTTPRMDDHRVDRLAAFLPLGLGLTRLRSTSAIRAGSAVLRNVGRVGTAVSAYQYAKPVWSRLTDRSSKNYEGHIPLNWFENAFLAAGSGVIGVADTSRGDLVALLSETSSQSFMPRLHASMRSEPEGRQILKDRPLISSNTVDLDYLRTLRRGTLGREWVEWLIEGGVTPDTRHEVVHIDSPVLAYTMTRYRQTHDLYHTLFSLPPTLAYELSLKVLELSNMSLPVAGLSSAFGPFRLSSARRSMWREDWMPWALRQGSQSRPLVGVYWEKRWEQGLGDLRQELGVKRMDDAAVIGRWKSYRLVREKEKALRIKGEWVDEPEDW